MDGGGGASKNPLKNAQKIHKTLTLTSSTSSLKNVIKVGFFSTVINGKLMDWFLYDISLYRERVNMGEGRRGGGGLNSHTGGACCSNQILPSNLHPYYNQNHTFLPLAEFIIFLHSYIISIFNFFVKFSSTLKLILNPPLIWPKFIELK